MRPGERVVLRESNEPLLVLAILDAAGTLLVEATGEPPFEVAPADVMRPEERHGGCGCCG